MSPETEAGAGAGAGAPDAASASEPAENGTDTTVPAEGESTVLEIETVERGYEDLAERLSALGADVLRKD